MLVFAGERGLNVGQYSSAGRIDFCHTPQVEDDRTNAGGGRALDAKMDKSPAVSIGIISALGRIWGKAIQSDAKISPTNYGGPQIDLTGRQMRDIFVTVELLLPMSIVLLGGIVWWRRR